MHANISNGHDPAISAAERAYQQGHFLDAERLVRGVLESRPDDAIVGNLLGLCLIATGRPDDAAHLFSRLTQGHPREPLYWNNLGIALRAAKRYREAEQAYVRAVQLQPRNPHFIVNLAYLFVELKRVVRAKELLWAVFELDSAHYEARIYGAQMCLECGEEANAKKLLEQWPSWARNIGGILRVELAALLLRVGSEKQGEELLREQLNDPVAGAAARARLILVLERFNRTAEARMLLAQLPKPERVPDPVLRGEIIEANAVLAARDKDVSRARGMLESLLTDADAGRRYEDTCFLLAKLCDKQGDYAACMEYLRLGHESQLKIAAQLVPELMEPSANPLNITNFYVSAEQIRNWKPVETPTLERSPIFVLGFPRSGTTMLEQMLDAHPGMASMDERPFVQRVIERMQSLSMEYPERLGDLDSAQCEMLREVYWKAVSEVVQLEPGQRLVDKNPLTMLRLPLLVRLFPRAKIIFVIRHPCDVVLSNYMQHFNAPAYIALCSTLPRLATGYAAAMRFWFAHADMLKPSIFEWRYEDAVRDFSTNVRRLGSFLELDDVTPLHSFSEHAQRKGYIATPSYAQVVQPVYEGSVGRWRNYQGYFESTLPILEPVIRHWNYDA